MKGGNTPPFVSQNAASLTGKAAVESAVDAADHALLLDTKQDHKARLLPRVPVHENARWGVVKHTPLARGKISGAANQENEINKLKQI